MVFVLVFGQQDAGVEAGMELRLGSPQPLGCNCVVNSNTLEKKV